MDTKDLYPSFVWVESRGTLFLRALLPSNYQEKVPQFYKEGGKENLEKLARNIEDSTAGITGKTEIKLRWDEKKGLIKILIGPSGGCYLEQYSFQEHNLGAETSLMTSAIIINYINSLLGID